MCSLTVLEWISYLALSYIGGVSTIIVLALVMRHRRIATAKKLVQHIEQHSEEILEALRREMHG